MSRAYCYKTFYGGNLQDAVKTFKVQTLAFLYTFVIKGCKRFLYHYVQGTML
jgi:hypothetical protein